MTSGSIISFIFRCNGQFDLVVDHSRSRYTGYLSGLSGDNIAYVMQACDDHESVSISHESCEIRAEISSENTKHIENVLYLNFDEKSLTEHFSTAKEWKGASVKFLLKEWYFISLQRFVRSLSLEVVQRLIPSPQQFIPFYLNLLGDACYESLSLKICSEDQRYALGTIISSPSSGPPVLVTGAFGTGKTRILALTALYYLQHSIAVKQRTCILVCTQQHTSAEAFVGFLKNLSIPKEAYVARVTNRKTGYAKRYYNKSRDEFADDFRHNPPSSNRPYLVITTCQTAHTLKKTLPTGFSFTHILLDEGAQMREPEAVVSLCFANVNTKIVIAGDKQQVCYKHVCLI